MNGTLRNTMVASEQFKHDDACKLFNAEHAIPQEVADVLNYFDSLDGHRAVSGGCNGCTTHALGNDDDVDAYAYYVAQNSGGGGIYVGFDSEETAYQLIGIAAERGVDYEWDGDTGTKVFIGSDA